MRGRLAVVGAVGALALSVAGPAVGAPSAGDAVAVAATGTVAQDGTVTLSGTYHCSTPRTYVTTSLTSGGDSSNIGNSVLATCDGAVHSWTTSGKPYMPVAAGTAQVRASLVQLTWNGSLVPEVDYLTFPSQDVMLSPVPASS
ncbi:hypothetical protein P3T36_001142 [Kitasatospora sp. MAP12-15]|uniref:DUF6299 family protein n=1 Tax=unclassified Kitasatospora TaxID=2633591 RepID=UPI002476774E|nr:DUF6299 family protein [Kitasatospora sp. MAP12-44]MDH6114791.1 hypothetical protein [Kitasatospora sp. MAP12-44]